MYRPVNDRPQHAHLDSDSINIYGLNIHLVPIFVDFIQFDPYFRFMFN